ncbi:MAG TPA: FtsX-like permease family protein [Acidobacteriota bacterium]|nr:FtsX-like permease family protein [Acidobacteriota bacterium]
MKIFGLLFRNALRHRLRTLLTIAGVGVAILAFGVLRTMISAWYTGVAQAAPDRLVSRSKISITFTLPLAQKQKIERIPGVAAVTHGSWFAGYYKDPKDFFPQIAFANAESFRLFPEYIVDSAAIAAFGRERNAAIVGSATMERFGWEIGDNVRLTGTIYPGDWDFVIRGIYTGREEATDITQFFFHWDYIDLRMQESFPGRVGQVGWWIIKIDDPARAADISAAVDREFANSADETLTETEAAFQQSFMGMVETIIKSLEVISALVIGIILLVAANTMAMTARERISEYAVLKTLGFSAGHIIGLIGGESLLISGLGGALGILLLIPITQALGAVMRQWFPAFPIDPMTYVLTGSTAILVGILAAVFPAWRAIRLRIADGLRRIG